MIPVKLDLEKDCKVQKYGGRCRADRVMANRKGYGSTTSGSAEKSVSLEGTAVQSVRVFVSQATCSVLT